MVYLLWMYFDAGAPPYHGSMGRREERERTQGTGEVGH
jgi:hypothetical protein